LIEERARLVREVGCVIQYSYEGSFVKFLESCEYDAIRLVRLIAKEFTGFRDEAIYQGEQVFFYKRAQLLVAHFFGALD